MTQTGHTVRKVLLTTLSNIGDAIMTTPVMEALHARYPQAQLDIVIDPRSADLFEPSGRGAAASINSAGNIGPLRARSAG